MVPTQDNGTEQPHNGIRISVIVPVYNMASDDKLTFCMDSLVAQTLFRKGLEIIAVDDCSTDASYEILQGYAARFPGDFHAYRMPENRHQGGAKNLGLARARGEWIGFIDSDDWVVPDYYERLLQAALAENADMAGCDYSLVDSHTFRVGQVVPNNTAEQAGEMTEEKYRLLLLDTGSLVTKLYRRHVVYGKLDPLFPAREADGETAEDVAWARRPEEAAAIRAAGRVPVFPEGIFYEDNAVSNDWMLRVKRFAYLPEPLYYYYQHEASTVHTITKKRLEDRAEAGRLLLEAAKRGGYLDRFRDEIEFQFTVLFYINTLFSAMPAGSRIAGKYTFCRALGGEMREHFPGFQDNPYYRARIHPEEKKLIAMQMKSHLLFYLYYKLLWFYRGLRKKLE